MEQLEFIYRNSWEHSVYTSFFMIEYILEVLHRSWADFLVNPHIDYMQAKAELEKRPPSDLTQLWQHGDGLCTSLAVFVANNIDANFSFQDLQGYHRAALSPDGLIIDSMARKLLSGTEGQVLSGYKGKWKFLKSPTLTLSFKSNNQATFDDFSPLQNREEAIVRCLLQLTSKKDFICMFRTISSSKLRFNGRICFNVSTRVINWSRLVSNEWVESKATFNGMGTAASNLDCRESLLHFGVTDGRREQYERVSGVIERLWDALLQTFGFPELK
ncbi:hypothetical protein H112_01340 [Trichophyton rubrum D6]|uniref:Uncharacterized protein n=2 Tax=Trichophyton rubrum TaxID=5551 RepID=F2SWN8_TRIRC|nr:uncharacterized protein TERG_06987 [Trichophyton rubrum CBS 118892]EZF26461.1 hypothetical protein H100_01334 [Trichophyton rubrum MR850]EZF45434.1 hypothetical protein H102_01329 [Trichophyton rubrum CBS 100081]EZF56086.1 hypothetical protein H103_01338 [Trichophyton rubrum CBS 288.86]EZF66778.1 hypothetical protein H104_01319 [Trichophyton rubrum CBS 289.86]EZF88094.1 hypothetical protein H110_01337 [Trichophyton rubrum MR1448]EZF98773.1 hypothetical protein H113_01341 [Trichophyton rubr